MLAVTGLISAVTIGVKGRLHVTTIDIFSQLREVSS